MREEPVFKEPVFKALIFVRVPHKEALIFVQVPLPHTGAVAREAPSIVSIFKLGVSILFIG